MNDDIRARLERDIENFFAAGGEVTEVPFGVAKDVELGRKMTHAEHKRRLSGADWARRVNRAEAKR